MKRVDFDAHAADYARLNEQPAKRRFAGGGDYFMRYKAEIARARCPGPGRRVLDYGCGVGLGLAPLCALFADGEIGGWDPSAASRRLAAERAPAAHLFDRDPADTAEGGWDLVFLSCVLHHVEPAHWRPFLQRLRPLLAADGRLLLFEHNPWNPLTRHLVNNCPFDRDAVLLSRPRCERLLEAAGFIVEQRRYAAFFPHALRRLRRFEPRLGGLPLGGQYWIAARAGGD